MRRVGERFTGSWNSVPDPLQTSRRLALLKASYFPGGGGVGGRFKLTGREVAFLTHFFHKFSK